MTIQTVPLQTIQPPQHNPRRAFIPVQIEGLAASIRQDGILQNLVVTPTKGKQYRVISGERRFRALKLLQERSEIAGDYEVPVEVRGKLSKDDALRLATVENVQRENLLGSMSQLSCLVRMAVMVPGDTGGAYRGRHVDVRVKRSRSVARTTLDAAATPQAI